MTINDRKQWWAPVRKGLVIGEPIHRNRMGSAVWLFLYLIENADRQTGTLFRKMKTIATDMVTTRETVMRWMVILRTGGYIVTRSNGRSLSIRINKWRSADVTGVKVDVTDVKQEKRRSHSCRCNNLVEKDRSDEPRNEANLSAKNASSNFPINNSIIKNSINHISCIESAAVATPTPASRMREFISSEEKQKEVIDYLASKGMNRGLAAKEVGRFLSYWTEPNKSGTRERWETEKTFEINRRLATWFQNVKRFDQTKRSKFTSI